MFRQQKFLNTSRKNLLFVLLLVLVMFSLVTKAQQSDPTKPFGGSGKALEKLNRFNKLSLQSIVNQNNEKSAIISGKLLKVGDKIRNYTLKTIKINSVILKSADNQLELSLFSDVMAKPDE